MENIYYGGVGISFTALTYIIKSGFFFEITFYATANEQVEAKTWKT